MYNLGFSQTQGFVPKNMFTASDVVIIKCTEMSNFGDNKGLGEWSRAAFVQNCYKSVSYARTAKNVKLRIFIDKCEAVLKCVNA